MGNPVLNQVNDVYEKLLEAEKSKKTVKPFTQSYPNMGVDEAYQVQLKMIDKKIQGGQRIVGKKIGLTSLAMQQLLGVDQPDYGHLLDSMEVPNKGTIAIEELFQPKIEAEIAFVLKKDLVGPSVTIEDVLEATDYIIPALEVVDSRIEDWKIKLQDTVADNASSALYVLGEQKFSVDEVDLPRVEMKLYCNDEYINTGCGTDVLGHPASCVAWLANKLSEYNVMLRAGEVILSGALSSAIVVAAGDSIRAEFGQLGKVEVNFSSMKA